MRGNTFEQVAMLSTLTPDELVPKHHPIRRIKVIVERALAELSPEFDAMYSKIGHRALWAGFRPAGASRTCRARSSRLPW
jgi:hypothetical protein